MTRSQPTASVTSASGVAVGDEVLGVNFEALSKRVPKRSRASAKKAGSSFERSTADHLAAVIDDRIDRRVKTGNKDRGDIGGLRHMGGRIVIECKDYGGRLMPGPWIAEAETERGNDDALAGLVIAKRRGTTNPGDQYVLMTVNDLTALLTGERHENQEEA